jgi:hypothetical protein
VDELTDERINLLQTKWSLGTAFQIATDEAVFLDAHLECGGTSFIDGSGAVLFG